MNNGLRCYYYTLKFMYNIDELIEYKTLYNNFDISDRDNICVKPSSNDYYEYNYNEVINPELHNKSESDTYDKVNEVDFDIFIVDLSDDDLKPPEVQPIHCKYNGIEWRLAIVLNDDLTTPELH